MSDDVIKSKKDNLQFLRENKVEPYKYSFERTGSVESLLEKYRDIGEGQESPEDVAVAGRIISIRGHGKTAFGHIKDFTGKIQFLYIICLIYRDKKLPVRLRRPVVIY